MASRNVPPRSPSLQRLLDSTPTPNPANMADVSPSLRRQIDGTVVNRPLGDLSSPTSVAPQDWYAGGHPPTGSAGR